MRGTKARRRRRRGTARTPQGEPMMPVERTHAWRSSAEQLQLNAPARSCRRRHNGTATDTRTAQPRLPKLQRTAHKRRHRATGERGKRSPDAAHKDRHRQLPGRVKAHRPAHRKHNNIAADGASKEAASTTRRQPARQSRQDSESTKRPSKQAKTDGSQWQTIERGEVAGGVGSDQQR